MSLCPSCPDCGVDIDNRNISSSRKTISDNKLEDRVTIIKTKPNDPLIPIDKLDVDRYDTSSHEEHPHALST
jgi:tRNA1(Val) A37 N6-methylase TrmN6